MGFKFSVCRQLLHLLQTKLYYNQQCLALTTEASPTLCVHPDIPEEHYILLYDVDSELTIVKVLHIYPTGQGQGHSWRRQYDVHVTLPLLQIPSQPGTDILDITATSSRDLLQFTIKSMSPFLSTLLVHTVICQTCLHHDTSDFHNYCIMYSS